MVKGNNEERLDGEIFMWRQLRKLLKEFQKEGRGYRLMENGKEIYYCQIGEGTYRWDGNSWIEVPDPSALVTT